MKFQIIIGRWMVSDRGVFRLNWHVSRVHAKIRWQQWDRVL